MFAKIPAPEIPIKDEAKAILFLLNQRSLSSADEALSWITLALLHPGNVPKVRSATTSQVAMLRDLGDSYFDSSMAHLVFLRDPTVEASSLADLVHHNSRITAGERRLELVKKVQFPDDLQRSIDQKEETPITVVRRLHHQMLGALSLILPYCHLLGFVAETYGVPTPGEKANIRCKTLLQQWTQAKGFGLPNYAVLKEIGPDHAKTFEVCVRVANRTSAKGSGASKRRAEEAASRAYLQQFSPHALDPNPERGSQSLRRSPDYPPADEAAPSRAIRNLAKELSFPRGHELLLLRALTHPSANPRKAGSDQHNRTLAVLGDFLLTTAAKHFLVGSLFSRSEAVVPSLAIVAGPALDKTGIAPLLSEMELLPHILVGGAQKADSLGVAAASDFVKAFVAARFLAQAPEYDLVESLPRSLINHFGSVATEVASGGSLKTPTTRLMELAQRLRLIPKFEAPLVSGPQHAAEMTARLTLTSVSDQEGVIVRGGKGSNGAAARHSLAAQVLGLIKTIHSDLQRARTIADTDTVEKLARLVLPCAFVHAPATPREAAEWRAEGLLGTGLLIADDFSSFTRWATEAVRYLPADPESRAQSETAALRFYAQMPPAQSFDILSFARQVIEEIMRFAASDDALSTRPPIQEMDFFTKLQELLQVINLARKERVHESSLAAEFAALEMLRRRDTELSLELGDGSASWREREGSCLELLSYFANWLISGASASKLLITSVSNRRKDTFQILMSRAGDTEIRRAPPPDFEQSLLVAFLRADGFLLDVRVTSRTVEFTGSAGLRSENFVEKVRATIAAPFRGNYAALGNVLSRILHDLKNHLLGAEIASRRPIQTRTERLISQAEASSHLDSVRRLGEAFGVLSGALEQPEFEEVQIREFFRRYCTSLLNRLPQTVALNVPRNLKDSIIRTSRAFLESILENLVKNAVEAMREHGQISIDWNLDLETDSLIFFVEDTGPGMNDELLAKLICGDPIRSDKAGGSGVGMITVTSMLRRLGGELRGESKLGEGTAWTVTIPSIEALSEKGTIQSVDLSVTKSSM
jgi:dsRNA-specific ribonuclease/signal transduction histidine kinase